MLEETTSPCQKKKKKRKDSIGSLERIASENVCACICVPTCDKSSPGLLLGFRAIGFRPKEIRISGKQERERERERETTLFELSSREISSRHFRSIGRPFPSKMERFRALAVRGIRRDTTRYTMDHEGETA